MAEKKIMYRGRILAGFFMLICWTAQAQQTSFSKVEGNPFYERYELLHVDRGRQQPRVALIPKQAFTSVAFSLPDQEAFLGMYCVINGDSLGIRAATHQPPGATGVISELLVFDVPQEELYLHGPAHKKAIQVHFMNATTATRSQGSEYRQQKNEPAQNIFGHRALNDPCEEPEVIPQSDWREGLPEPDYTRSYNEVAHLIVHHSATSNNLTNYRNVVRNIYLYHTEVNGWSDIGYNYLIAPDGKLFAGRDPGSGEQDNVRGAHFCGQNARTMGICLLGDYTQTEPREAALQSLEKLLSWKSYKEGIEAIAEYPHPANSSLPVIAGHQDGCATACPGRHVYEKLPVLRLAVQQNLQDCEEGTETVQPWVYFAPNFAEVCLAGVAEEELSTLQMYDVQGRRVSGLVRLESQDICFKATHLAPGVYFLQAEKGARLIRKKFMIF